MRSCYLLDTNIISELRKPTPNENVLQSFAQKKLFSDISSITWAESLAGVKRMPESKKKGSSNNLLQRNNTRTI